MNNLSKEELEDFQQAIEEEAMEKGLYMDEFEDALTLEERDQFLFSNWREPDSPIYLRDDVPLEQLKNAHFFYNARTLLTEIEKENGFGITKKLENIQRKHVENLVEKFKWPEGFIENIKRYKKVIDEEDIWPLHTLRVFLDVARFIRKQKGKYVLVKKQAHLLEKENAGKLYQLLFSAFFRQFNMAYLYDGTPIPYQQDSIPYILYRLQLMDMGWVNFDEIMDNVFLDTAHFEFYGMLGSYTTPGDKFYYNIIRPLEFWGLVETRQLGSPDLYNGPDEARKTPLFDAFLKFNDPFKK